MGTFYVNDTSGNDGTGTEDNPALPYKTIGGALADANTSGDIVEIIDEQTYVNSDPLTFAASNVTLRHTASELGRPVIDGTGLGTDEHMFIATGRTEIKLEGIEVTGPDTPPSTGNHMFDIDAGSGGAGSEGFEITDCFIHGFPALADGIFNGTQAKPVKLTRSAFMFSEGTIESVRSGNNKYLVVENCFLSRSSGVNPSYSILKSFGGANTTASFCTFVFRGTVANPINQAPHFVQGFAKVINCVATSSNATNIDGFDALDHSFNVVNGTPAGADAFQDGSGASSSLGTGDTEAQVTFVRGASIGRTEDVVQNFALVAGSVGVDQGTSFNSVDVDINGTVRPQGGGFDMGAFELAFSYWNDFDDNQTHQRKWGTGLEIHGTANKLTTRTFPRGTTGRQAPYFVTIPGVVNLRQRTTAYKNET